MLRHKLRLMGVSVQYHQFWYMIAFVAVAASSVSSVVSSHVHLSVVVNRQRSQQRTKQ